MRFKLTLNNGSISEVMNLLFPNPIRSRGRCVVARSLSGIALLTLFYSSDGAAQSPSTHFDVNDISFLFPSPKNQADTASLISLDMQLSDHAPILADETLKEVIDTALSVTLTQSSGATTGITIPDKAAFTKSHNWKVAAIRVDPSAPGTDDKSIAIFGSIPQVRLIVQPVTDDGNGGLNINDFAMHLVFDFTAGFEPPKVPQAPNRAVPDKAAFRAMLETLKGIKALAQAAKVQTEGDLAVHPGFRSNVPGFADAVKGFISKHLSAKRLGAIAFMGVHDDAEPWIFFAMIKQGDKLILLPHPTLNGSKAQMLTFSGGAPVVPASANTNFVGGVSTLPLFESGADKRLDSALFPGNPRPELQAIKFRDIPDIVANPHISNFPNTDCVSCHTESARRHDLNANSGNDGFAYQRPAGISGVASSVLPTDQWNVRNFGWSPFNSPPETATMRTGNEAAACADFINREYFGQANAPVVATAVAQAGR